MKKIYFLIILIFSFRILTPFANAQQRSTSVTVYNTNLALVEEIRPVDSTHGEKVIRWKNVPAKIDPTSVHVRWLGGYTNEILEQNFEYDLVDIGKLFQKYIDRVVELHLKDQSVLKGKLLGVGGALILETPEKNIVAVKSNEIVRYQFPELPEGLITQPTLIWLLKKPVTRKRTLQVEYLTSGMSWHAEYVGMLSQNENRLDVSGWVSLENHSGALFKDTKLKLIAGQPHRAARRVPRGYGRRLAKAAVEAIPSRFSERAAFEYHLYNLKGRTTLKQNETKQIPLFSPKPVQFKKIYKFDGQRWGKKVKVFIRFQNSEKEGVGRPLPAGKFRIYQKDTKESAIFLGEDWIDHTSKGGTVTLEVGNAFDIHCKRTRIKVEKIGRNVKEETYQIEIRNFKDNLIVVDAIEHLNYAPRGEWKIVKASQPYNQT
ncbi:MAG TPA: hypothetical protein ENH53_11130, partial [Bacteroidetes bacterium]|nr:hypothetical protein [Bacteroidota bacterium]